ncbi:MAG: cupredoxin domain-containing protein [bacterium]|nr:cupredoxin domain-containing protein [bacterium]
MWGMKATTLSILIAGLLIGGSLLLVIPDEASENGSVDNVSIVDGKQIIEIGAKGGYVPRNSVAKAGIPTVLRFDTKGTFDCSSSVRIPSMNISKNLPPSGMTDIDVGNPKTGTLQGTCGMGMYNFKVQFN